MLIVHKGGTVKDGESMSPLRSVSLGFIALQNKLRGTLQTILVLLVITVPLVLRIHCAASQVIIKMRKDVQLVR